MSRSGPHYNLSVIHLLADVKLLCGPVSIKDLTTGLRCAIMYAIIITHRRKI